MKHVRPYHLALAVLAGAMTFDVAHAGFNKGMTVVAPIAPAPIPRGVPITYGPAVNAGKIGGDAARNVNANPGKVSTGTTQSPGPTKVVPQTDGIKNAVGETDPDAKNKQEALQQLAELGKKSQDLERQQRQQQELDAKLIKSGKDGKFTDAETKMLEELSKKLGKEATVDDVRAELKQKMDKTAETQGETNEKYENKKKEVRKLDN